MGMGMGSGAFATGVETGTVIADSMRGAELVRQEIKESDGMQDVTLQVGDPGWAKKMEQQQLRFGMSYYVPDGDFRGMRQHESVFSDSALDIQMQIIDDENQRRYGDVSNLLVTHICLLLCALCVRLRLTPFPHAPSPTSIECSEGADFVDPMRYAEDSSALSTASSRRVYAEIAMLMGKRDSASEVESEVKIDQPQLKRPTPFQGEGDDNGKYQNLWFAQDYRRVLFNQAADDAGFHAALCNTDSFHGFRSTDAKAEEESKGAENDVMETAVMDIANFNFTTDAAELTTVAEAVVD